MESHDEEDAPQQSDKHGVTKVRFAGKAVIVLALFCGGFLAGTQYQNYHIALGSNPGVLKDLLAKVQSTSKFEQKEGMTSFEQLSRFEANPRKLGGGECGTRITAKLFSLWSTQLVGGLVCYFEKEGHLCAVFGTSIDYLKAKLSTHCDQDESKCTFTETADHGGKHAETLCVANDCKDEIEADIQEADDDAGDAGPSAGEHAHVSMECEA
jgi:hypothetical protein